MDKEYRTDREYSPSEIFRFNLKMWWLAGLLGLVCAAVLGGYKYVSLEPYLEEHLYVEQTQIQAALFLSNYSEGSAGERANNIMRMAKSNRAYQAFCRNTGYVLTLEEYQDIFQMEQTEASDVVSLSVVYPAACETFGLEGEEEALVFAGSLIAVIQEVAEEMIKEPCVGILDEPYAVSHRVKLQGYSLSRAEYMNGILKASTAGFFLGVLVEVVLYSFCLILSRRPVNADEVRTCLDTAVIDVVKEETDRRTGAEKAALFLRQGTSDCNRVCCLPVGIDGSETAKMLAESFAREQRRTLFVDLSPRKGGENTVSAYIMGTAERVLPLSVNPYLDIVSRDISQEAGMTIAGNKRFASYLDEMDGAYDCIVINGGDLAERAEGYVAAKLCTKVFVVCARKAVKCETLYRVRNTAETDAIAINGVLIYEY